ncbi:MAG: sensor histidine kinase, partial [Lentisphaerae bacterium]
LAIAETGFAALRAEEERARAEQNLNSAHEEGMLQISTGIIHNIGNAITVIQIALERMRNGELQTIQELAELIDREIIPDMMDQLEAGRLQYFLTEDPQGQEYLGALKTLIGQIPGVLTESQRELDFIVEKFKNVTEIITLQQQFIGELGTENLCIVNNIVQEVINICQQPIEENQIELRQKFREVDRILVDTAMLRHILLLLMKMAIEAAASSRRAKALVKVETFQEKIEERDGVLFVAVSIADNGAGRSVDLDNEAASLERSTLDNDTRNLLFIKKRVEKYGGFLQIKSEFGIGTRIVIFIPSYDANPRAREYNQRHNLSHTQKLRLSREEIAELTLSEEAADVKNDLKDGPNLSLDDSEE